MRRFLCFTLSSALLQLIPLVVSAEVRISTSTALSLGAASLDQSAKTDDVFSAAIEAMGGRRALEEIKSIKADADCTGPKGAYKTELSSARGDRLMFRQTRVGRESFLVFVNGKRAWSKSEETGKIAPLDKKTVAAIRSHEFQMIAIATRERYSKPQLEGYEKFAGSRAIKVRMMDELGNPCHVFFDADSHLMAGMVIVNPMGEAGETVRIVFNRWSQIGKVKLPSTVTATDKTGDFVLNFHNITLNEVAPGVFSVPKEIQNAIAAPGM